MAKRIYYKSDFDFRLDLTTRDSEGNVMTVPWPECDFSVMFWTCSRARAFHASCIGGVYRNCYREEDGAMHFVFDGHNLGIGRLHWEPHFMFPDKSYPDGIKEIVRHDCLDMELTESCGGSEGDQQLAVAIGETQRQPEKMVEKRKEPIPFLTRGLCRTGSKPGYAYRRNHNSIHYDVLISGLPSVAAFRKDERLKLPYTVSIAKAFPGGKFRDKYGNEEDIKVIFNPREYGSHDSEIGSYDRETGKVTLKMIPEGFPGNFPIAGIYLPETAGSVIGVDENGRVKDVDVRKPWRYGEHLDGFKFRMGLCHLIELMKFRGGNMYNKFYCLKTHVKVSNWSQMVILEIQRRKRVQIGHRRDEFQRYIHKWCHVVGHMKKMGVIRVRVHTRGKRVSDWQYYSYVYTDKRKEIRRIDSDRSQRAPFFLE